MNPLKRSPLWSVSQPTRHQLSGLRYIVFQVYKPGKVFIYFTGVFYTHHVVDVTCKIDMGVGWLPVTQVDHRLI